MQTLESFDKPITKQKVAFNGFDIDYSLLECKRTLPSLGNFYPVKYALVRGMRLREQLEVSQITESERQRISTDSTQLTVQTLSLLNVYSHCIQIENVSFNDILWVDFYALALWVVLLTNPKQRWEMQTNCPECKKTNTFPLNITKELDIIEFTATEPKVIDTELGKILIAPTTIQDLIDFSATEDKLAQHLKVAIHCKKLNGNPLTLDERLNAFGMLGLSDAEKIANEIEAFESGIRPVTKECKHCKAGITVIPSMDITKGGL